MRRLVTVVLTSVAAAAMATQLDAAQLVRADATPPANFAGTGTTYWEYAGNDGWGHLAVTFDTTEPGLAANQADVTYTFDSGTQPFSVNSGQMIVTGDWVNGWDGVATGPQSHVHIGPAGGASITFHVDGFISQQRLGFGQGPWEADGSFVPQQSF